MTAKIKTVIIDDEENCLSALELLIEKHCPELVLVNKANSVETGVKAIEESEPDLVFLDIRMPDGDGFSVLDKAKERKFEVIFTTAHEEYAIRAFEFSAIHYLLKPIDKAALIEAVERLNNHNRKVIDVNQRLDILKENFNENHNRIMLPSMEGFSIYKIEDIIRCEAEGSYTNVYLINESKPVLVSNPIGNYEKLLIGLNFCRVHNKHLVNLKHVTGFHKAYGGFLVMQDGTEVKVADRKKNYLLEKLKNLAIF
ncbi:MAG: response regulator transcription factor [Bacteroidales bacterium]|nr:response regulator transcription factor [Bacteroidales bacterium]